MKAQASCLHSSTPTPRLARGWPKGAALGAVAVLAAGLALAAAAAAPGSVDLSFDPTAGGTLPGLTGEDVRCWAVALQPDARILLAGGFTGVNGQPRPGLARLWPQGVLDSEFDPVLPAGFLPWAVAVQPDGKVLVGGLGEYLPSQGEDGYGTNLALIRLNADGTPDAEFHRPGFKGAYPMIETIALQPDGKILVGGLFFTVAGLPYEGIVRLEADGTVDTTFQPVPLYVSDDPGYGVEHIHLLIDGRILIAGGFQWDGGGFAGVARLNPDGTVDSTFWPQIPEPRELLAFAVGRDGSMVLGDPSWTPEGWGRLFKLRADGTWDLSFQPPHLKGVCALAVQPDGKILAATNAMWTGGIVRLNPNGSVDAAWQTELRPLDVYPEVRSIALQRDGQVLIAGAFASVNGVARPGVARLNNLVPPTILAQPASRSARVDSTVMFSVSAGGTPPLRYQWLKDGVPLNGATNPILRITGLQFTDAGSYRVVITNVAGSAYSSWAVLTVLPALPPQFCAGEPDGSLEPSLNNWLRVTALARQADGRLLIGGGYSPALVRLYADGSLDTTFASSLEGWVSSLVLQPDGKVLVAGDLRSADRQLRFARLNPDGSLDPGFNVTLGTNEGASVRQVVLQLDRRILIAGGFTHVNGHPRPGLARLNADGSLDESFMPDLPWSFTIWAMVWQTSGRVVLSGCPGPGLGQPSVFRLNANGSLDRSFQVAVEGSVDHLASQPGGSILMAGDFFAVNGVPRPTLARLNADGSLDLTFNPGASPSGLRIEWVDRLFPLRDGRIIVSGDFSDGRYGLLRLNADGSVDPDFEVVLEDTTEEDDPSAYVLAEETQGRVVVGGWFNRVNGLEHRLLVRLFTTSQNCPGFVTFGAPVTYADEPSGSAQLTLLRTTGTSGTLAVHYATTNLEAVAGADYTAVAGVLTFADGETQKTIAVPLLNDGAREANERFALVLTAPTNARPLRGDAARAHKVMIVDDENAGWPGSVDPTFVATVAPGYYNNSVRDMALQPDGRIVICGTFNLTTAAVYEGLARLEPNGALDPTFNPAAAHWRGVRSVALQPDGKLLIGGRFTELDGVARLRLARLQPDGSLDPGFAPQIGNADLVGNEVLDIVVQPDGRVLIGGCFDRVNGVPRRSLARLHPDGSLDAGFAAAGVTWHGNSGFVHEMALQPDGKVLVGGQFHQINGVARTNLARLNPDGALDLTFNPTCLTNGVVKSLAVQPDGKVVVGGSFNYRGTESMTVARLNADGSLDTGFRPPSPERVASDYDLRPEVSSLALQWNGKIVIAGIFSNVNAVSRNHVARLNPDGSLDLNFFPGAGLDGRATKVLLQPDGQVLVAGWFTEADFLPRCFLARLNGDRPPPGPFVRRQISQPTVQLVATPPVTVSVYAVEDQPPTNWAVSAISHGGVFDAATGKVKFGPFYDHEPRTLSYTVTPPPGASGIFIFHGQASADGLNTPITGEQLYVIAGFHPAEHREWRLPDWHLTMDEVTGYASVWRRGLRWPVPPQVIPMDYVTRAAYLWRGGECYTVDLTVTNPPLWWVNCEASGSAGSQSAVSQVCNLPAVQRRLPAAYVPGEPLSVALVVCPGAARAWAVEERCPAGWAVSAISDGGEFDAAVGAVRWGPFYDSATEFLSYVLTPPVGANGEAALRGVVSLDGSSQPIGGPATLRASCRLHSLRAVGPGQFRLGVVGPPGAGWLIEASSDLVNWSALTVAAQGPDWLEFTDPEAVGAPQRFYRARLVP